MNLDATDQRSLLLTIAFRVVAWILGLFFVLTIIAMVLYPGGSVSSPESQRYSFFFNFFSDLGQTHVGYGSSGAANLPSMFLFGLALTTTAAGLVLFLWLQPAFPRISRLCLVESHCAVVRYRHCRVFCRSSVYAMESFLAGAQWFRRLGVSHVSASGRALDDCDCSRTRISSPLYDHIWRFRSVVGGLRSLAHLWSFHVNAAGLRDSGHRPENNRLCFDLDGLHPIARRA